MKSKSVKRMLSFVAAAAMALTLLPAIPARAAEVKEGDFGFDGTTLVKYYGNGGDVVIPEKTTKIKYTAFEGKNIKSVVFNDKLQSIEGYGFARNDGLTSVTLPGNLHELGEYAFGNCTNLKEVTFTGHTLTNTDSAFKDCNSFEKATFTDQQLTTIPRNIFKDAKSLTTVIMPDSVTEIGDYAFCNCTSLEELSLPASVTTLDYLVFYGCKYLKKLVFNNNEVNSIVVSDDAANALPTDAAELTVYGYDGSGADLLVEKANNKNGTNIKYQSLGSAIEKFVNPNDGYQYYWKARESDGEKVLYRGDNIVSNEFVSDGEYTYYCQKDGTIMKNRLTYHPDGEHVIFFDENGREVFNAFTHVSKSISGEDVNDYCYFNINGYMYVNTVTYDVTGTKLYYIDPYGRMENNGWFSFDPNAGYGGTDQKWHFTGSHLGFANYDGTLLKDESTFDYNGAPVYMQGNGEAAY